MVMSSAAMGRLAVQSFLCHRARSRPLFVAQLPLSLLLPSRLFTASSDGAYSPSVVLTAAEERLFGVILDALRVHARPDVVLRVAGGWVRDKLLQRATHDVDLAVAGATGEEVCAWIAAHVATEDAAAPALTEAPPAASRVAVVRANPAQSKHLATAIMKLHGFELNVNHLRSELYAAHSRIPAHVAHASSPAEDALRRDFTVNALYYNLHTRGLEDWTQRGLVDLRARRIRTPLPAALTLREDPLRALRAVRFAVYLRQDELAVTPAATEAMLDAELCAALRDVEVHAALAAKVSRERIALEMERLWALPPAAVARAYALLAEFRLMPLVFPVLASASLVHTALVQVKRTAAALTVAAASPAEGEVAALFLAASLSPALPSSPLPASVRIVRRSAATQQWLSFVTTQLRLSAALALAADTLVLHARAWIALGARCVGPCERARARWSNGRVAAWLQARARGVLAWLQSARGAWRLTLVFAACLVEGDARALPPPSLLVLELERLGWHRATSLQPLLSVRPSACPSSRANALTARLGSRGDG